MDTNGTPFAGVPEGALAQMCYSVRLVRYTGNPVVVTEMIPLYYYFVFFLV